MADNTPSTSQRLMEKLQVLQEPHMLIEAYLSEEKRRRKGQEEGTRKIPLPSHQEGEADFYINLESFGPNPEEAGLSKEILESRQGKWGTEDVVLSTKSGGKGGTASSSSTSTSARRKAASKSNAGRQESSSSPKVQTPPSKKSSKK